MQHQLCLVIGDPIEHSLSPLIHNAGYGALEIQDRFRFEKERVEIKDLPEAVERFRASMYRGISCTLPHKIEVIPFLDEVDETAGKIGAVNTIVNDEGILKGYNTDWHGILNPLQEVTELAGKKVAILGAGGAARSAVYACLQGKAIVTIFNRTPEKAEVLSQEFECSSASLDDSTHLADYDVIINTTSVGMTPHMEDSPIAKESMRVGQIVFDIVYNPYETKLLQDAKKQGATVIHGTEMFIHQAAAQFELYTGEKAPVEVMRKTLLEHFNIA